MEAETVVQIITAIVAVYGAGISTYTLVSNNKEKKRQIKVSLSIGYIVDRGNGDDPMLIITVTNPGFRTVTINTPEILLPDGKKMFFPDPLSNVTFPFELHEGKNCMLWTKRQDLLEELIRAQYSGTIKIKGACRDATDKVYISKSFDIKL